MRKRLVSFIVAIILTVSATGCVNSAQDFVKSNVDITSTENATSSKRENISDATDVLPPTSSSDVITDIENGHESESDNSIFNSDLNTEDATDKKQESVNTGKPSGSTGILDVPSDLQRPTDSGQGNVSTNQQEEREEADSDSADSELAVAGPFNKNIQHQFFATDVRNSSILIYDLNLCNGDYSKLSGNSCVVWEWIPRYQPSCKYPEYASVPTAAKLRYSPVYDREVVIACAATGWAGIIDYDTFTVLFEIVLDNGPHDVELLPNGDFVVAGTGGPLDGSLVYLPLSAGVTTSSHEISTTHGHGVLWDEERECLWVLEDHRLWAVQIEGYGTAGAKMKMVNGSSASFSHLDYAGHAFVPVYGTSDAFWFSGTLGIWTFDKETGINSYPKNYSNDYTVNGVKGIAWFSDGTMVQSVAGLGPNPLYDYSSNGLRLITVREVKLSNGEILTLTDVQEITIGNRDFYKVFPVERNYR